MGVGAEPHRFSSGVCTVVSLVSMFNVLFFFMWSIFQIFIEFVSILFLFYVLFFGRKAYRILAPRPGIEPTAHTLEGEVLPTGLSRKSHHLFLMVPFHLSDP